MLTELIQIVKYLIHLSLFHLDPDDIGIEVSEELTHIKVNINKLIDITLKKREELLAFFNDTSLFKNNGNNQMEKGSNLIVNLLKYQFFFIFI